MDDAEGGYNTWPNIEYPFIPELVENYEQMKMNLKIRKEMIIETAGWLDDMKFLFRSSRVFTFSKKPMSS